MTALQETQLFSDLTEVLKQHPQGLNEHTLLKELDSKGTISLEPDTFSNNVKLFRTHFMLFNALYQLRDELWRTAKGHLEITPVRLTLMPYQPGSPALHQPDPMRDYYLDIDMLEKTTEQDIETALNSFWKRLHQETIFSSGGLTNKALKTLGLPQGATSDQIRLSYRRLAMQHHPDRGGEAAKLQEINEAMQVLRPLLK